MWEKLGGDGLVSLATYPIFDESMTVVSEVEIAIQINGKLRGVVNVSAGSSEEFVYSEAEKSGRLAIIEGKTIIKKIFIPDKILNIVVK